uniref:Uncharacterized protein n=1 Tax=Tanacetum cinerariifolium TaxID=118510 RepID=A0A699HUB4_TANCI|nr:hypothetical protein [Tanacetum cinerariifolium]
MVNGVEDSKPHTIGEKENCNDSIQRPNLQSYEQYDDEVSTLVLEATNKVGTLTTCAGKVLDFKDDEDVKGLEYGRRVNIDEGCRVNVKHKSTEYKVRREKMFEVDEALDSENSKASSFQVRVNDRDMNYGLEP